MSDELVGSLRRELLDGAVDEERRSLRITGTTIQTVDGGLEVAVDFVENDQRGQFERPFDDVDMQMLTEATPSETAAAIATWIRLELVEYINELTAEGRWKPEF